VSASCYGSEVGDVMLPRKFHPPSIAMKVAGIVLLAALAGASGLSVQTASDQAAANAANPIRRVVTMLQNMQKKIAAEGEKDQEIYDKFMCYCKGSGGELSKTIAEAETKVPQVSSALAEAEAMKEQLESDLQQHKSSRAEAKEALAKATALREKEAAAFAQEKSDMDTNIAALAKATAALEKGATGFLQTTTGSVLRKLAINMDLSSVDRDVLASFLSTGQGYAPQGGEITGILKEMKDTMEKELATATSEEQAGIQNFQDISDAKGKEIAANSQAIEEKTVRLGDTGVKIETLKEDLSDTQKSLIDDKKFLADLDTNCQTREAEFDVVKKTRADELVALADTIKILNDDDALDLFKKTLPGSSSSLIQNQVSLTQVKERVLKAINAAKRAAGGKNPKLDLIALALNGKKVNFDKVLKMIDEMVVLLAKEQTDDNSKKSYCEAELDKTEDKGKALDITISDLEKDIEDGKSTISTLTEEISTLTESIKDLDKSVAEATENRKAENSDYKDTMAADGAAKEILGVAKNRLNKFYNPKMYQAPPKRELSEEERISENMSGAAAFVQVRMHSVNDDGVAPPPPPQAVAAYKKKGQESAGVLTMIDMLVADLDKEMQELTVEEKDSQKEYESTMADSAAKRAGDAKSIADKEGAKADLEAELEKNNSEKKSKANEAMATAETLKDLHLECDWLTANFDARKEARAGEVESLKQAKAVLSGADFSL
jgi:hypothetical protein